MCFHFFFHLFVLRSKALHSSIQFLVIGDWGGDKSGSTWAESQVAEGMTKVARDVEAQFVISVGDNFYAHGVKSVDDNRFKTTFEDVFTGDSLQIPWWVIAGNHDHFGNVSAQIQYSSKSPRWDFPWYWYSKETRFSHQGRHLSVEFLMFDSLIAMALSQDRSYFLYSAYDGLLVDPVIMALAHEQLVWLEKRLSTSKADFLFVVTHFPIYSGCMHGRNRYFEQRLLPILRKHKVTAFLSGHDHCMEYIETNPPQIIAGAGAQCCQSARRLSSIPKSSLRYMLSKENKNGILSGFAHLNVTGNCLRTTFYSHNADVLFTSEVRRRISGLK